MGAGTHGLLQPIHGTAFRCAHWKEANLALQQIMADYAAAGTHRVCSTTLLNAGLKYLTDLRRNAEAEVAASDAHTLLRAIETLDLIDNGEIVMHGALERKESRGMHQRSDFTFTNPLLADKFLTLRKDASAGLPDSPVPPSSPGPPPYGIA